MSRHLPPGKSSPGVDVDAVLRALVDDPVPPPPPADALDLRERVVDRLDAAQAKLVDRRAARAQWTVTLTFAVAACLPFLAWATLSLVHRTPARQDAVSVMALVGGATVAHAGTERQLDASLATSLGADDELRTGPGALVRASLPTGATVDVGPSARLRFAPSRDGARVRDDIELVRGKVQVQVPRLAEGCELRVRAEDATVVVHGTRFSVERTLANDGSPAVTRVTVTEGRVSVFTGQGEATLSAGEAMAIAGPVVPVGSVPAARVAPDSRPAPTTERTSTLAAENALLTAALQLRRDGHDAQALARLDDLLDRYPASPLAETACVERLRTLRDLGYQGRLQREAERYLSSYPQGFARAEASRWVAGSGEP